MTTILTLRSRQSALAIFAVVISTLVLLDTLALAGDKGRDIIIYNGKVILKSGKKKGNIIISNGHEQGKYKYKKKYMNYGGFWR